LALLIGGVAGSAAPAAGAVGSYYASAAAWAWNVTWPLGVDKFAWGSLGALASGVLTALIVRKLKGNWRPGLIGGMAGTVGGAAVVLLGMLMFNFVRYPVIQEAKLQSRPHILGTVNTFLIFDALRTANLQVPGGWSILFTRPSEESGRLQSDLTIILQKALGEREVHLLELPEYSINADALRFPEPAGPGITIYGNNPLVDALRVLAGCFSIKITQKTFDGFEQVYSGQNVVWIDIGKGSPRVGDLACSA
jgi:hypothetical protein